MINLNSSIVPHWCPWSTKYTVKIISYELGALSKMLNFFFIYASLASVLRSVPSLLHFWWKYKLPQVLKTPFLSAVEEIHISILKLYTKMFHWICHFLFCIIWDFGLRLGLFFWDYVIPFSIRHMNSLNEYFPNYDKLKPLVDIFTPNNQILIIKEQLCVCPIWIYIFDTD